jgi:lysophospholipase L1-like esterase
MNAKGIKINFLGDSITQGVGADKQENRYTDVVQKLTGATVNNYGISGTRIARQVKPYNEMFDNNDFIKRVETMDKDADIVFIFGGTNDYGHGDAPIGTPEDRDIYTFYGAMHTLCKRLLELYPGKPVVIMTPLHRLNEENVGLDRNGNEKAPLKTYVDIIREVAEIYSLPVLDLYKTSGMQPSVDIIRERFMPDGLHPSTEGHALLAKKIVSFINCL